MADNEEMQVENLIYSNGINGSTKQYLTPPMTAEELVGIFCRRKNRKIRIFWRLKKMTARRILPRFTVTMPATWLNRAGA